MKEGFLKDVGSKGLVKTHQPEGCQSLHLLIYCVVLIRHATYYMFGPEVHEGSRTDISTVATVWLFY